MVLPVPGGPQKMIDCSRSRSIASRNGRPGPTSSSCPSISSSVRGRMRSASGTDFGSGARFRFVEQRCHGSSLALAPAGDKLCLISRSLAARFVDQHGRRDGDVQDSTAPLIGMRECHVCALPTSDDGRPSPSPPTQDRDGHRRALTSCIGTPPRGTVAAMRSAGVLQRRSRRSTRFGLASHRQAECAAHRRAQRLPAPGIGRGAAEDRRPSRRRLRRRE